MPFLTLPTCIMISLCSSIHWTDFDYIHFLSCVRDVETKFVETKFVVFLAIFEQSYLEQVLTF